MYGNYPFAQKTRVGSVSILSQYRVYLQIVQIIIAVALTVAILLQARGAGLGSVFGGTGAVFKTRRGIDRLLFRTTIVLAVLFGVLSLFVASIPTPA
jgi:preprotein translocase subunit SecG